MNSDLKNNNIVVASPHSRNDILENNLRDYLKNYYIIRLRTPEELTIEKIKRINPKFLFFPHWSWKIPEDIYNEYECVIFHPTDLPYGRGGTPIQNLILYGHQNTQISALKCIEEYDAGPIYCKCPLSLHGTVEDILQRASSIIEKMIIYIIRHHPRPVEQNGKPVIFKRRNPSEGNLSELDELNLVYDYIRMLDGDGYPKAFLETSFFHFEFFDATMSENEISAKVYIRRKDD